MTQTLARTKRPKEKPNAKKASEEKLFYTIEDLEQRQNETKKNFHLIKGKLVEIMPAGDLHGYTASTINIIISEWIAGGVKLVWLVNPETETIATFNRHGEVKTFAGKQKITGEEVIKKFGIETSSFFE